MMKYLSNKCIFSIALFAICGLELFSTEVIIQNGNDVIGINGLSGNEKHDEVRVLSRKRRFIQFPEGSSFQVVYDQTIPVIGSTLLFTVGVTVALAYQLPSISFGEIFRMLQEQAVNGTLDRMDVNVNGTTLNRIDTNVNVNSGYNKHSYYYTNPSSEKSHFTSPSGTKNILSYNYNAQHPQSNAGFPNKISYYTEANDYGTGAYDKYPTKWQQRWSSDFEKLSHNFVPQYNSTRKDWTSLVNRYLQDWVRRHPPNYKFGRKRFYPVFGKRSIDEHTHPEDKFFLNHHRSTRHDLYRKIEKFLDTKGHHGHHCVLRALCESGQRRHNAKPESFLREIMKAIFSLPTTHETPTHHAHKLYDEAHGHIGDCAEKYSFCKDSIWSDDFVF
ncbi:uncharacterized protein LOC129780087 [Toxorhynchites rutilus septentrionalis]|uniref:uncharacterized protein LOC129780087 n=1 Tax=Toxorhynchites rutilus septentrionalis TaxID=329112 RepID=UPI00247A8A88|nr:uncharacterized protein LOC129780087 [Toxorhynchites rutilus septentrionalis]